jgi:hypothetical protein
VLVLPFFDFGIVMSSITKLNYFRYVEVQNKPQNKVYEHGSVTQNYITPGYDHQGKNP